MRILHVDPEVRFGGGERQVLFLLRELARRGFDVAIAAPPDGALTKRALATGVEHIPVAIRNDVDLIGAFRLARAIRGTRPDIVHFHTSRAFAMAPWLPSGTPFVVTRRMDYRPRNAWWSRFLFHRRAARVVAISTAVEQALVASGVDPGRIARISSAVDVPTDVPDRDQARRRLGLGEGLVIVSVGALVRRKGHDVLLEAIATLDDEASPVLVLCGEGPERGSLDGRARRLGLAERVRFLGEIDDVAIPLAAADVFAQPSRHEGLGVAVLEAMAHALPVVASDVGGIPDAVADGVTGRLVPAGDSGALARALRELLVGNVDRLAMGRAGRDRAREEFSVERMGACYEALYREITATGTVA